MAALDATVVGIALPAIGRDFHAGVTSLQWVVDAYTLTLAGLLLLGGTLGDSYGRRKVFAIGVVWFALASLLCGLAPTVGVLIAARALQGVGGALLTPGSLGDLAGVLRRGGPLGRDRRVVRTGRRRHRDRPVPRRVADRRGVVAAGVLHQPPAGGGGAGHCHPARAGNEVAGSGAAAGRQGRGLHQRRAGRHHLRAHPGVVVRLGVGARAGAAGRGAGAARPVHPGRGQGSGADAAARDLRLPAVLRGQRGDLRRLRGAGRAAVPRAHRAAGGPRLQPDRGGHGAAAGDLHHARAFCPVRERWPPGSGRGCR